MKKAKEQSRTRSAARCLAMDDLADELVLCIATSAKVAGRMARLSRRYRRLMADDGLWRRLYIERFGPPPDQHFLLYGKDWRWLYRARLPLNRWRTPKAGDVGSLVNDDHDYWGHVDENGVPHGFGIAIYRDGGFYYTGDWVRGKWQGKGHFVHTGAVRDGEYTGCTYSGDWYDDSMHGSGTMVYPNGDVYTGKWRNGRRCGHGVMTYSNGERYAGGWKDGKYDGCGTLDRRNERIEVEFAYGEPNCEATVTGADGAQYKGWYGLGGKYGYFVDRPDGRHAYGRQIYPDGGAYDGKWQDNKRHGHGVHTYPDGSVYDGQWSRGLRHGHGRLDSSDGTGYIGEWKNDKRHGRGATLVYLQWEDDAPAQPKPHSPIDQGPIS
ncbi:Morn repeat domain containing protein [Pandoravirus macleodensis]|uniref:Morn repeat domain containing protein n=1 Tax=Pandoravirus macleodensis TaxID=2107707 RepID=A0A2U7UFA8_9VIRU|nr:Morn repeat domain containing protein [Pandoravirus macleodensis]AVK77143.1 Morn repeat domain containing protein [Pandoravirus macleodensis]